MMFAVAAAAILITIGLALVRALLGQTVYDRILAVNMIGTKTVLLIAVFAFLSGRTDILDIALIYAPVSYTHLTLPTNVSMCRSRWSPDQ